MVRYEKKLTEKDLVILQRIKVIGIILTIIFGFYLFFMGLECNLFGRC